MAALHSFVGLAAVFIGINSAIEPPAGLVAHDWSSEAMARTTYLGKADVLAGMSALPRLSYGELMAEARTAGKAMIKDIAVVGNTA